MAGNYWASTQRRHWQYSKSELAERRRKLEDDEPTLVQGYPLPHSRHLSIFFNQQINRLSKRLQIRQQAMASAQLYVRRFYSRIEIRRTNPYLVLTTAVYLACKMEECPQHIRLVVSEARSLWPDIFNSDISRLGECEFYLISELNSQLIVHQPYRTLTALQSMFAMTPEEHSFAWSMINDSYMTDLPMLYAPHLIGLTSILLALLLRPSASTIPSSIISTAGSIATVAQGALAGSHNPRLPQIENGLQSGMPSPRTKVQRFSSWLAESGIDVEGIIDCTQEMISFYEFQETYNEKLAREQIHRFVKARGLDK